MCHKFENSIDSALLIRERRLRSPLPHCEFGIPRTYEAGGDVCLRDVYVISCRNGRRAMSHKARKRKSVHPRLRSARAEGTSPTIDLEFLKSSRFDCRFVRVLNRCDLRRITCPRKHKWRMLLLRLCIFLSPLQCPRCTRGKGNTPEIFAVPEPTANGVVTPAAPTSLRSFHRVIGITHGSLLPQKNTQALNVLEISSLEDEVFIRAAQWTLSLRRFPRPSQHRSSAVRRPPRLNTSLLRQRARRLQSPCLYPAVLNGIAIS